MVHTGVLIRVSSDPFGNRLEVSLYHKFKTSHTSIRTDVRPETGAFIGVGSDTLRSLQVWGQTQSDPHRCGTTELGPQKSGFSHTGVLTGVGLDTYTCRVLTYRLHRCVFRHTGVRIGVGNVTFKSSQVCCRTLWSPHRSAVQDTQVVTVTEPQRYR